MMDNSSMRSKKYEPVEIVVYAVAMTGTPGMTRGSDRIES
jgi:hypothetical protein